MSSSRLLTVSALLLALLSVPASLLARPVNPRLAVVISKSSFERTWDVTQMSGHAWVGLANLAGIPYDTLFLEDIAAGQSLAPYRVIVLAQCTTLEPDTVEQLTRVLDGYLKSGGSLIIDGPVAGFAKDGKAQTPSALWSLLSISSSGPQGDQNFRIQVAENRHYIRRPFEHSQYLSPLLARSLNVQQFSTGGHVLLTSTDGHRSFPFLSYRDNGKNRIVLISDATTFAGATSVFRNEAPQGFFANQVANVLIRAIQWAIYGDMQGPFPAVQFSNADMAVIVRLDGDNTQNLDFQKQTFNFLYKTARETGVVPLYTFVSSAGAQAGWKQLAELGQQMEDLGGQIGSHSKFHRIESRMGPVKYKEELDGSIEEIESNMAANGAHIGKVDLFINPGDTIVNSDYEEVARRFHLMMTHGFEQDTPIGNGVMSWFTGNHKDFVVLDDTPSPDYQWFYDPTWSYTTAQITSYQEATFDHFFHGIGRGYIYNQMWHDYSISSMPVHQDADSTDQSSKRSRIANTSNIAMYEGLRSKFASNPIYCPEPMEVVEKLRAMAALNYSWTRTPAGLDISMDFSGLRPTTLDFIGGMGIRIENTGSRIESVTVNGQPHQAFSDRVIILPNLKAAKNLIHVSLSPQGSSAPHVTYVSSRMPFVRQTTTGFEFKLLTKSKARFAARSPRPGVVLNADWQEFNRKGDSELTGYATSDRTLRYVPLSAPGFVLTNATVRIIGTVQRSNTLTLALDKPGSDERVLAFSSTKRPRSIRFNGREVRANLSGSEYRISLPDYQAPASVQIHW